MKNFSVKLSYLTHRTSNPLMSFHSLSRNRVLKDRIKRFVLIPFRGRGRPLTPVNPHPFRSRPNDTLIEVDLIGDSRFESWVESPSLHKHGLLTWSRPRYTQR